MSQPSSLPDLTDAELDDLLERGDRLRLSGHEIRQLIGALRRARARQVPASQSLNALRDAVHANAREKGFWDEQRVVLRTSEDAARCGVSGAVTTTELDHAAVLKTIPEKLMLIVTEVAEAMEDYRDPKAAEKVQVPADLIRAILQGTGEPSVDVLEQLGKALDKHTAKPRGIESELFDIMIRTLDLLGALGTDVDAGMAAKMKFNTTRSYKHGKVC